MYQLVKNARGDRVSSLAEESLAVFLKARYRIHIHQSLLCLFNTTLSSVIMCVATEEPEIPESVFVSAEFMPLARSVFEPPPHLPLHRSRDATAGAGTNARFVSATTATSFVDPEEGIDLLHGGDGVFLQFLEREVEDTARGRRERACMCMVAL